MDNGQNILRYYIWRDMDLNVNLNIDGGDERRVEYRGERLFKRDFIGRAGVHTRGGQ